MNPRPRLLEMPKRTVQSPQPLQPLESSFSGNAKVLAFPMPVITQALMSQERDQTKALREARGKVDRSVIRKLERELESTRVLIRRLLEAGATREWASGAHRYWTLKEIGQALSR